MFRICATFFDVHFAGLESRAHQSLCWFGVTRKSTIGVSECETCATRKKTIRQANVGNAISKFYEGHSTFRQDSWAAFGNKQTNLDARIASFEQPIEAGMLACEARGLWSASEAHAEGTRVLDWCSKEGGIWATRFQSSMRGLVLSDEILGLGIALGRFWKQSKESRSKNCKL